MRYFLVNLIRTNGAKRSATRLKKAHTVDMLSHASLKVSPSIIKMHIMALNPTSMHDSSIKRKMTDMT